MTQKMDTIKGKRVYLSEPYEANVAPLVAREDEMRLITAAWIAGSNNLPLAPLLLGDPGVGKNRLVYELARRTGKKLYIFQGHQDVTAEDLACSVRFSDDKEGRMDYVASPLITAMHCGGICFIDEIGKIRSRALALLVSVLDERRYIDSTLLGARVEAHKAFRFIAATNTADLEGSMLPEFLRSRMRPAITVGSPSREEIEHIIKQRYWQRLRSSLQIQVEPLLNGFWELWGQRGSAVPPTPRDAIHVFDLALNLADFAFVDKNEAAPRDEDGCAPLLEMQHLRQAFNELFRSSHA